MMRSQLFLALLVAGCQCGPDRPGRLPDGGSIGGSGGNSDSGAGGGGSSVAGGTAGGTGGAGGGFGGSEGGGSFECDKVFATIRDFRDNHPDFERFTGSGATTGLVRPDLGADFLPVYAHAGATSQTSGPDNFNQWYRDAGVNMAIGIQLPAVRTDAGLVYDNSNFFPVDNQGWGNQGRAHNFHFTTVIRTGFTYHGGERFSFRGDDDVWIFVNGKLALDLGGLHSALAGSIDFDQQAQRLGLVRGTTYRLDVFHAERHTTASNFRIETSIDCLQGIEIQ